MDKHKKGKVAYLTFDDGPSLNTVKILELLDLHNIKSTFFVVGREDRFHKNIYKQIAARGHAIGNHTYSHDYKSIYSSINFFKEDFYRLEALLKETIGQKPEIFRFPGGSSSLFSRIYGGSDFMKKLAGEMLKEGYRYFDWNVDSRDGSTYLEDTSNIVKSVFKGAENIEKAIILMHDAPIKTTTAEALEDVLDFV